MCRLKKQNILKITVKVKPYCTQDSRWQPAAVPLPRASELRTRGKIQTLAPGATAPGSRAPIPEDASYRRDLGRPGPATPRRARHSLPAADRPHSSVTLERSGCRAVREKRRGWRGKGPSSVRAGGARGQQQEESSRPASEAGVWRAGRPQSRARSVPDLQGAAVPRVWRRGGDAGSQAEARQGKQLESRLVREVQEWDSQTRVRRAPWPASQERRALGKAGASRAVLSVQSTPRRGTPRDSS